MVRHFRRLVAAFILPLLLFSISAPATDASAAATSQTTVVDDLWDFGKIAARSGNLKFERTNNSFLGNDASRLARSARRAEWAVWSQSGMRTFAATAYFWPSEQVQHFAFAVSTNRATYTAVTPTIVDRGGDWRRIDYTLTLPAGTNHVRVTFPNASAHTWNPQIGQVTYSNVAPALAASNPGPLIASGGPGFVGRQGNQFTLNGHPFRFVGFNLFDAAATARYQCAWWDRYTDQELDAALAEMKHYGGASVLRFWAFQSYTASGTDWSGVDRVLALARKHDMKVIPVLENGQEHCTSYGSAKWQQNDTFYRNAHRRDYRYGYALSLPDYIDTIVARYKDDPTIMAWMIMNEADTGDKDGLYTFASVLSAQIKAIDSNHLVTLGTQSNGVSGSSGADFLRLYGLPTLDFAEGHDYAFWAPETEALPGSPDGKSLPDPRSAQCLTTAYIPNNAKVGCSLAQSLLVLDKPFLMGEAGVKGGGDPAGRQRRAELLDAKMTAFFANGGSGYLIWQWNRLYDGEGFDVIDSADPLLPKMKRQLRPVANAPLPSSSLPTGVIQGQATHALLPSSATRTRRAAADRRRPA